MTQQQKDRKLRQLNVELNVFPNLVYSFSKDIKKKLAATLSDEISDQEFNEILLEVEEFKQLLQTTVEQFDNTIKTPAPTV